MNTKMTDDFDAWYNEWLKEHPGYAQLDTYMRPAMEYAFFSGGLLVVNKLTENLDKLSICLAGIENKLDEKPD